MAASGYQPPKDLRQWAIVVILVGVGAGLVSVSWWTLLPLASVPLLMAVELLPRLLQPPARSLVLRSLYASLYLVALIIILAALENIVQPAWLWAAEDFIFDHRDTLDAFPLLKPAAILPIIGVCGAISFCRADTRPIKALGWALSFIGNLSLFIYTLSFFTLFTVVPTRYLVDKVQAREIAKYQIVFDAEKKAVGRYLASQAVQEILTENPAQNKSPLRDLLNQIIKAKSSLVCRPDLHDGACAQSGSELQSSTRIIEDAVHDVLAPASSEMVDNKQFDISALVGRSSAESFRTVEDFSNATRRSTATTNYAMAQAEAINVTLVTALGSLLDLGPDMNRYFKDALDEVLETIFEQYVIPALDRIAMQAQRFSDFLATGALTEFLSVITQAIRQTLSIYDSPNSLAVRFQQLVSDKTESASPVVRPDPGRNENPLIKLRIDGADPSKVGTEER